MACTNGGYAKMQRDLVDGRQIGEDECPICSELLIRAKFDIQELQDLADSKVAGANVNPILPTHAVQSLDNLETSIVTHDPHDLDVLVQPDEVQPPDDPENFDGEAFDPDDADDAHHHQQSGRGLVLDRIRGMPDVLQELVEGSDKRTRPILCLVCTAARKKRTIFDLAKIGKDGCMHWYLDQHLSGVRHLKCVELLNKTPKAVTFQELRGRLHPKHPNHEPLEDLKDEGIHPHRCEGFQVDKHPHCRLYKMKKEFELWMMYCKSGGPDSPGSSDQQYLMHTYIQNVTSRGHIIFHKDCSKHDDGGNMCATCSKIGVDKSIVRNITRFYTKYMAGQLLQAKLYGTVPEEEVLTSWADSGPYKCCEGARKEHDLVKALSLGELQRYVREAFMCIPERARSPALKFLVGSTIFPATQVHASHSLSKDDKGRAEILARQLTQGKLGNVSDVDIKLACYVGAGALQNHPIVHGILVTMVERFRREQRNVHNFKKLQLSEAEKLIVSEAGVALSAASCNKTLLKEFGMLHAVPRVRLFDLLDQGLPDAFCAISSQEVLKQNGFLLDSLFPRKQAQPRRRFTMAFDKTYVLRQSNAVHIREGRGMVGRCSRLNVESLCQDGGQEARKSLLSNFFMRFDCPGDADIVDRTDWHGQPYASEMLACLVWDAASKGLGMPRFPLLHLPMASKCSGDEMLWVIGDVMEHAGSSVKCIVFDNHSTHASIKACLLGQMVPPAETPFFGELDWTPLPGCCLPRFMYSIPLYKQEPIYGLNGPCHIVKNVVSAMRSPCRSIVIGAFTVDMAGARDFNLPPASFCGYDPQSDLHAALYLSPFFLVDDDNQPVIPWALQGASLMNLIISLVQSAVQHENMTVLQRLENAMACHFILDLAKIVSLYHEDQFALPRGSAFLPNITVRNIQDLCGFVAVAAKTLPSGFAWRPWRMTEMPLETYFGLLRSQYQSAQMSVRDFLVASGVVSKQYQHNLRGATEKDLHGPSEGEDAMTDTDFRGAAERAKTSGLKFMSWCSNFSEQQLWRLYGAYCMDARQVQLDDAHREGQYFLGFCF